MKFLLVSNGRLAEEMYNAMKRFYAKPEIEFMGLTESAEAFAAELKEYFNRSEEEILVVCDIFGSAAFNETVYLINRLGYAGRVGVVCGMNLPMVFKLYGLKDLWTVDMIKALYEKDDFSKNNIAV